MVVGRGLVDMAQRSVLVLFDFSQSPESAKLSVLLNLVPTITVHNFLSRLILMFGTAFFHLSIPLILS